MSVSQPILLGSHHYAELDSLNYVGFSSTGPAVWVLEKGQSGDKILVGGRFYRSLQVECQLNPLTLLSSWTLQSRENWTELRSAECVAAHSCYLSQVTRDPTVRLAGYVDHLNNTLTLLDAVKVLAV